MHKKVDARNIFENAGNKQNVDAHTTTENVGKQPPTGNAAWKGNLSE